MAGKLVAAQVTVGGATRGDETPAGVTLLVDTSASRALGFAAYVASIAEARRAACATQYGDTPVQVVAFDQDAETIYRGARAASATAQAKKLARARRGRRVAISGRRSRSLGKARASRASSS